MQKKMTYARLPEINQLSFKWAFTGEDKIETRFLAKILAWKS
jgi:hypothetical protein